MHNKEEYTRMADEELIRLTKEGDQSAFTELVNRYEPRLFAFSRYICKNEDSAEDTSQEAMIRAFEALASFKGQSSFSTWLHQIAKNLCWSKKRKERSHLVDSLEGAAFGETKKKPKEFIDWSNQPDKILLGKELKEVLDKAIRQLPIEYRAILVMKDMEELSNEEIAKTLGLSVPAVKSRLHRGRLYVRQKVDRYFREK